jgi:hypothetical protein
MEEALKILLPSMLAATSFAVYRHRCKDELLERLPGRLRGYASWIPENWRILVVVDRDDDDCDELKGKLESIAEAAGLRTRTRPAGLQYAVINRLAIEELEAWYFGDWEAVRAAYPRVSATVPARAPYRDPDAIKGGTWEAFEREMNRGGYFRGGLRKIEAARSIAPHMGPERNTSRSFQVLREALVEVAAP